MLRALYHITIVIMGIGLCCCGRKGGDKFYRYIGKSCFSANVSMNQFPGNQINPIFKNKESSNFYENSTRGFISRSTRHFRYGYDIEAFDSEIAVAAGDSGVLFYERKDDRISYDTKISLVSGRSTAETADIGIKFNSFTAGVPCFYGDRYGSRYGYESTPFSGAYAVSFGSIGDKYNAEQQGQYKQGYFVACGVSGLKFIEKSDFGSRAVKNLISSDPKKIIREVCDADEYVLVGQAKYDKPFSNLTFSDKFDQLDFFPEFGIEFASDGTQYDASPQVPESFGSGVCDIYKKDEYGNLTFSEKTINCGSVNDISYNFGKGYIASESGLIQIEIYEQLNQETQQTTIGVNQVNLISGQSVYSVVSSGDQWAATVKDGIYINGQFNPVSMNKNFVQDETPIGETKYTRINTRTEFSNLTREKIGSSFDIRNGSLTQGFSGMDNDLIIGAFPVALALTSDYLTAACWQGGLDINGRQLFDMISNDFSNWKSSKSASQRDGYANFQYTLSAVGAASEGSYTYILDCPQYIANSMGPGWYTPLHSQGQKMMEAPIELYLNNENGYSQAGSGILVLRSDD